MSTRLTTSAAARLLAIALLAAVLPACSPSASSDLKRPAAKPAEHQEPRLQGMLVAMQTVLDLGTTDEGAGRDSLYRVSAEGVRETVVAEGYTSSAMNTDGRRYLYGVRDEAGTVAVHLRDDVTREDEQVYAGDVLHFGWAAGAIVIVTGVLPEDTPGTPEGFRHAVLEDSRVVLLEGERRAEAAVPEGMRDFSVLWGDAAAVYFTGRGLAGQFGWSYGIWRLDRASSAFQKIRDLGNTEEKPGQRLETVQQVQYAVGASSDATQPFVALCEQVMTADPADPTWPNGTPRVYGREERVVIRRLPDMTEIRSIPATPAYTPFADQAPQTIPMPPRRIAVGPAFDRYLEVAAIGRTVAEGYGVFEIDLAGRSTRLLDAPGAGGGLFGPFAVLGYVNEAGDIAYTADAAGGGIDLRVLERGSGESSTIARLEEPPEGVSIASLAGVLRY